MLRLSHRIAALLTGMVWLICPNPLQAVEQKFAARYESRFVAARGEWQSNPTNSVTASNYAVACFDMADYASNSAHKAEIARQGVAAARALLLLTPQLPAGHYYLALNLGQLADATRSLGGLKLVAEMEREFHAARELDSKFDFAGPDRSLGMLYRDAPGWPISVGSRSKARTHFERARELKPEFPENQLALLESWLKWGERKRVQEQTSAVERVLIVARTNLSGEAWGAAWLDWDARWQAIQKKAGEVIRPSSSPKGGH